jgi:hypothetical protein
MYQERVMNRFLYGDPEGYRPEPGLDETLPLAIPYSEIGPSHPGFRRPGEEPDVVYDILHPFVVEPAPDAPVFGADFRELDHGLINEDTAHPLMSACRCGNQIVRQAAEGSWEHC